jgi:hypothetical protein
MTAPGNCGRQTSLDHPGFGAERKGEMMDRRSSPVHPHPKTSSEQAARPAFQPLCRRRQQRDGKPQYFEMSQRQRKRVSPTFL